MSKTNLDAIIKITFVRGWAREF
ncbi:hypothetical protein CNEO2_190011 [Clostridium neonatale]|nr:hypothetical protein CNEO_240092 [Clostridium neonatale]CAI3229920.1 hypothetical protein CNEO2_190011 [Clostridium neonatale]CAI3719009.1 hypothetical protein CNEO3_880011 [Clostridium neonatale]CAI3726320.1 hypothetical protein CNEO4_910011 [Clostridium neonatale]